MCNLKEQNVCSPFTFEADNTTGYFLITAPAAEYLTAYPTMMSPQKSSELTATVITLLTATVGHPRLPKITVLIRSQTLSRQTVEN